MQFILIGILSLLIEYPNRDVLSIAERKKKYSLVQKFKKGLRVNLSYLIKKRMHIAWMWNDALNMPNFGIN